MYGLVVEDDVRSGTSRASSSIGASDQSGSAPTIERCRDTIERMLGRIKAEYLFATPATASGGASGFKTQSTVGMILNGCAIDSLVVGGPEIQIVPELITITQAYASGQLDRNDIVLKVDGVVATNDNILRSLVGDDVPGSELTLTVQKGGKAGNVRVVKLQRIATERIADRRRMFELFTLIKARGSELQDDKIPSTVDKCISTWTNMLVADAYHQQKAIKRFKSLREQCIRWLDQLCQDLCLPARGRDSHGMQKPASAHASPLDAGKISLLLGEMCMELSGAADILRKYIDEESLREISADESTGRDRRGEMQPLPLKERVTRDAIERGIFREDKSHERKAIARLETEVHGYKETIQKLQQQAEYHLSEAKEARALAEDRCLTAELWRQKAEDCYRGKSIEKHFKLEREKSHWEASMRDRDAWIQSLEERLSATEGKLLQAQTEKNQLELELRSFSNNTRVLEEKLLAEEQLTISVQQMKQELHMRSHACTVQIEKLEQEVVDLSLKSRKSVPLEALNKANAEAQSYLSTLSRMQEESHLLDLAASRICDFLDSVAAGNREYGDLQGVGIMHYLSNYQHLNGLARTLGKMSNQLAVIAGLETEKIQMQEKLVQVQGRLDELQSGLTEAGVAGKHDLLLLTDQARSTSQLHERIKQLSADLDHKKNENEIQEKVLQHKSQEAEQEMQQLKATISLLEHESSTVKAELGKTRLANARLSTVAQDLERENAQYRPKFLNPTDSPRSRHSPTRSRDSPFRHFDDETAHSKLEVAMKRIRQQDEEIQELKGYCTALQKNKVADAVTSSMLGIA